MSVRGAALASALALSGCSLVTSLDPLRGTDAGAEAALPDGSSPDASCGDLQTDGKNCGACGHDCLGGRCTGGACDPAPLASAQVAPGSIAVDSAHVYWIVGGSIRRTVLATDGTVETVGKGTLPGLGFLTVDGANLVATAQGAGADVVTIPSSEVSGVIAPSLTATFGGGAALAFGLDAQHLFLFQSKSTLFGCPVGGNCLFHSARNGSGPTKLWSSTLSGDRVATEGGRAFLFASDTLVVSAIGPADASATQLATLPAAAGDLAADADRVYATVPALASIVALPRNGGPITTLATTQPSPRLLTAGAGWIAWQTNTGLMGCDPAACSKPTFYAPYVATSIAIDAKAVYWTDTMHAGVYMMPR